MNHFMPPEPSYSMRLYLANQSQVPAQAIEYLKMICEKLLPGPAQVEVIDLSKDPDREERDGVVATPMLVKLSPPPVQKIIGNLGEMTKITQILGLEGDYLWRNGDDLKS
jgi:circadian clock protein KaiB